MLRVKQIFPWMHASSEKLNCTRSQDLCHFFFFSFYFLGRMQVHGAGPLLMYASTRPQSVWVNLAPRSFTHDASTGALEVEVPQLEEGDLRAEVQVMFH
jgi:hypothetical protein